MDHGHAGRTQVVDVLVEDGRGGLVALLGAVHHQLCVDGVGIAVGADEEQALGMLLHGLGAGATQRRGGAVGFDAA